MGNVALLGRDTSRYSRESSRPVTPIEGRRYWNFPTPDATSGVISGPEGAVLCSDGSAYYGPLLNSLFHGFGIRILPDGTEIEGFFKLDLLDGQVLTVRPNGSRIISRYSQGDIMEERILGPEPSEPSLFARFIQSQPNVCSTPNSSSSEDLTTGHCMKGMSFGARTRMLRSITPPQQYASTSSSVRMYIPRPPNRVENWLVPQNQIQIESRLSKLKNGCSGCSVVYKASWLGKEVVVRTFSGTSPDPRAMELLSRMAKIRHPNIALFMAASIDQPGLISIVTEYAVNGSVDFITSNRKKPGTELSAHNILHIAKGVAIGCAYLRKQGFAHKNLKPSNVLIDSINDIKLTDYFVKEFNHLFHPLPCTADLTVAYVAPEALRVTPFVPYGIDSVSDVYSFGMILWELVSGRKPYIGLTRAQIRVLVGYGSYRDQPLKSMTLRGVARLIERSTTQEPQNRTTFERLVVALNSMHSSANTAAEDALITFISGRQ
jgi:hypothetical protein